MAYSRVEETFWHDRVVRALSHDARHFFLYLITSPHGNRLGCYVLDPFYAAADLQWTPERVDDAIAELVSRSRITWDAEHRVVLLDRFLFHNALENPNVVKGAIRDLSGLPSTPLLSRVHAALQATKKSFYRPLIDAVGARIGIAPRNRHGNGSETHTAEGEANRSDDRLPNGLPNPDLDLAVAVAVDLAVAVPDPDQTEDRAVAHAREADPSVGRSVESLRSPVNGEQPDPLAGFNAIGSRLAALQLPGGYQAAAELVRDRWLWPDDTNLAEAAEAQLIEFSLEHREQIVSGALADYRAKQPSFDPRLFAGFVRRLADPPAAHVNGSNGAGHGIVKLHQEAPADDSAPIDPEARAAGRALVAAAIKPAPEPMPSPTIDDPDVIQRREVERDRQQALLTASGVRDPHRRGVKS